MRRFVSPQRECQGPTTNRNEKIGPAGHGVCVCSLFFHLSPKKVLLSSAQMILRFKADQEHFWSEGFCKILDRVSDYLLVRCTET